MISIATDPLTVGKHKLTVRAFDAADNVASESIDVEAPALSAVEGKDAKPAETPPAPAPAPKPAEGGTTAGETDQQPPPTAPAPEQPKPAESPPPAPAPQS